MSKVEENTNILNKLKDKVSDTGDNVMKAVRLKFQPQKRLDFKLKEVGRTKDDLLEKTEDVMSEVSKQASDRAFETTEDKDKFFEAIAAVKTKVANILDNASEYVRDAKET
jgi:hypothetical protein